MSDKATATDSWCALLVTLAGLPLWAWAFSVVWNWFVAPVFAGLPYLTLSQALGLVAMRMFFWPYVVRGPQTLTRGDYWAGVVAATFGLPMFAVVFGAMLHWLLGLGS